MEYYCCVQSLLWSNRSSLMNADDWLVPHQYHYSSTHSYEMTSMINCTDAAHSLTENIYK